MTQGLSGIALYVPRPRVDLDEWSDWTGNDAAKIRAVVGRSFRIPAPWESPYTMAANAVLRLMAAYDVDPSRVGMLALGTETSTDNAAGAVIVRGLVDRALRARGLPSLSRSCAVPEVKHACLGGVYALQDAARYCALDGRDRHAIVVCVDVAEYERGSTGEQTQGAGAVAMLVDAHARLCEIDLHRTGRASAYRGADFRKPARRHRVEGYASATTRLHDFPVFNGRYSTLCYVDATVGALQDLAERTGRPGLAHLEDAAALFFHRPYHWMPLQAMGTLWLSGLADAPHGDESLREVAERAGVDVSAIRAEVASRVDLWEHSAGGVRSDDPRPALAAAARQARKHPRLQALIGDKLRLGTDAMMDLGNLYTAALPAWLAAGMEQAAAEAHDLAGADLLLFGYGSGDAAEAMTLRVASGWREAARRIGFADALRPQVALDRETYEALHDGRPVPTLQPGPEDGIVIHRVGDRSQPDFQDIGIEYYRVAGEG